MYNAIYEAFLKYFKWVFHDNKKAEQGTYASKESSSSLLQTNYFVQFEKFTFV